MIVAAFLAQVLRIVVPYLLAAAGGVLSERAGIVALTLEGMMLTGAFTAALGSYYAGSPWIGLVAGLLGGLGLALLLALATVRFKADQVVAGIALNLLAVGGTRFFLRYAFDSSSNSPRVPGFGGESGGATGAVATTGIGSAGAVAAGAGAALGVAKTCSSAARTMSPCDAIRIGRPSEQSELLAGSASWSPWKSGAPVHWLESTRIRTWVASVSGTSNERRVSSGTRGRGRIDGKASAGLV